MLSATGAAAVQLHKQSTVTVSTAAPACVLTVRAWAVADLDLCVAASCQHQCSGQPCWATTNHNHRRRQPASMHTIRSSWCLCCCCCRNRRSSPSGWLLQRSMVWPWLGNSQPAAALAAAAYQGAAMLKVAVVAAFVYAACCNVCGSLLQGQAGMVL